MRLVVTLTAVLLAIHIACHEIVAQEPLVARGESCMTIWSFPWKVVPHWKFNLSPIPGRNLNHLTPLGKNIGLVEGKKH